MPDLPGAPAPWNLDADNAEKIRRARQLADAVDLDRGFRTGLTVTIRDLADAADALLVERQQAEERGERDRQQIARLTEALEQIIRVAVEPLDSMTPVKPELRRRGQLMLDIARAVLAGEEDARP